MTRLASRYPARPLLVDRRGSLAVLVAVLLGVMVPLACLAVDFGLIYANRRALQNAADAAAIAAAWTVHSSNYTGTALTTAETADGRASAGRLGVVNGQNNVTVTINDPPINADTAARFRSAAAHTYVEAVIVQNYTPAFLTLIPNVGSTVPIQALAVAQTAIVTSGPVCLLSLSNIIFNSGSSVNLGSCGVAADSTSSQAVLFNGGTLTAGFVSTPGGIVVNNGATVNATKKPNQTAVTNPYASLPSSPTFPTNCVNYTDGMTPTPGSCLQNVNVGSRGVTFPPGTYYISGDMNFNSGAVASGSGVTFILGGNLNTNTSANINFTAQTSGTYNGVLFYKAGSGNININSGSTSVLNGALVFPHATVDFDSNSTVTQCNELIASSITFNSTSNFGTSCSSQPNMAGGTGATQVLVE